MYSKALKIKENGCFKNFNQYSGGKKDKMRNEGRKQVIKMADISPIISITALNMKVINNPIKRQRLSDWIKQTRANKCHLPETYFKFKVINRLKVKKKKSEKDML